MYRKFIEFAKLMNIYLNHFPKHEKYALANKIRNSAYEVYDLIVEGQKRYHKKTFLLSVVTGHFLLYGPRLLIDAAMQILSYRVCFRSRLIVAPAYSKSSISLQRCVPPQAIL